MKRLFVAVAMALSALSVSAFDFDGINLNLPFVKVAQEICKRGYFYNSERNCLQGICQGVEIYLSINYVDVNKTGMVGQLIVEIPMPDHQSLNSTIALFNVVYHQVAKDEDSVTYQADKDGTQLVVSQVGSSVFLTYNTPYYKPKK